MSQKNYNATRLEEINREMARRFFPDYLAYAHGASWKRTRFAEFVGKTVQDFVEADTGHAYDILILESPPQHGKSRTVSESLPSWYLGRHPDRRVIEVSYNEETATRFLTRNNEKVKLVGKTLFNIEISKKADRADTFELTMDSGGRGKGGGGMISRGVMSGLTGNPADLMIIDDPIKNRQEADSETTRDKIWGEWLNSMKSRLSGGAKVILIMTPWHEDDIRARMMQNERNVTRLRLPVEAEEGDPMGRKPGEPLCPEINKGAAWLAEFKESYLKDPHGGPRAWNALYMCNPVVEGGNMINRNWWQFYDTAEVTSFGTECITVDAAFKGNDDSDYVAIQVWGKLGSNYYMRYRCKEHLDFPATLRKIRLVRQAYPNARRIYIEDKANGSAVIQTLHLELAGVIPVQPKGGKVARVNAIAATIETGHVFLPKDAPWIEEFLREWSEFPNGAHDDEVDAATYAITQLQYAYGAVAETEPDKVEAYMENAEDAFLSGACYDVYGSGFGF